MTDRLIAAGLLLCLTVLGVFASSAIQSAIMMVTP